MQWDIAMDTNFQQKIKTSTHGNPIVQKRVKVPGGIEVVTMQTWMACTWKGNISHMAMGSTGINGKGIITHWKRQQWWFGENKLLNINE